MIYYNYYSSTVEEIIADICNVIGCGVSKRNVKFDKSIVLVVVAVRHQGNFSIPFIGLMIKHFNI